MGRPIKSKFFANTNIAVTGEGVGGEQVASVVVATTGSGWSTSTTVTWTASAPQIPGGQAASGTVTVLATEDDGWATAFVVTDGGSGYTSTSSVTLSFSPDPTTTGTYVVNLNPSTTLQNAIAGEAYITGGSQSGYDIVKQEASRRYQVRTSDGLGFCKLVTTATLSAGQMNMVATDANTCTYWVKKLTARRAVLVQATATVHGFLFDDNEAAGWTLDSASSGVVTISNQ